MLIRRVLPFLILLAFCSCEREDQLLLGEWQAISVVENGDSLKLNPAEIGFTFRPDNRYTFRSTLRYQEAGTWRYDHGYLFARDTTQPKNPERVVAIEKLNQDTLQLRMRADTTDRYVLLLRQ